MSVYQQILEKKRKGHKQFAVLIDPEKYHGGEFRQTARMAEDAGADYLFVGGSLLTASILEKCIETLKSECSLPIILFPGSPFQIHPGADAILLLSLISGRNPELLIGHHVIAAPYLKQSGLETISTGYMLIGNENYTTAQYISHTFPIPSQKPEIAVSTAMAGEMLGMRLIYMDAGSGATVPVSEKMINNVREAIQIPLVVGGGITSAERAKAAAKAGADLIVVGNAIETNKNLIQEISDILKNL